MPRQKEIIRTAKCSLKFANSRKKDTVKNFLADFTITTQAFIDFLWENKVSFNSKKDNGSNEIRILDIQNGLFDCPAFFDYKVCETSTRLSARAKSSAITMACGIIKAQTKEIKKLQFVIAMLLEKLNENPEDKKLLGTLAKKEKRLEKMLKNLRKPNLLEKQETTCSFKKGKKIRKTAVTVAKTSLNAELSSKNAKLTQPKTANGFDLWLSLGALGDCYENIDIPIKLHRQALVWLDRGYELKGSILLCENHVELRFGKKVEQSVGDEIGCDSGVNSCVTFSNQTDLEEPRINGWTYSEALSRLARKRRGSKNSHRAKIHVQQTINGRINLARASGIFAGVSALHLENNSSLPRGGKTSRKNSRHLWRTIRKKLDSVSEELGVQVILSWSGYKSQRCNACGWTQKSNRKGKDFRCKACGHEDDADRNASKNALVRLPWLPFREIKEKRLNLAGFFWNPLGPNETEWSLESHLQPAQIT
jgi:transposase